MGQQVRQILEKAFPGIQVDVDSGPSGRVNGHVIWDGFTGHDNVERQQMIRAALNTGLGAEVTQVGILLTYTPVELQAMMAA